MRTRTPDDGDRGRPAFRGFAYLASAAAPGAGGVGAGLSQAKAQRFERIVSEHFAGMWRFLRRLGLDEADTDDAAQEVLLVVVAKLDDIHATQRAALSLQHCLPRCRGNPSRSAASRRARRRRLADRGHADANPEELLELKRARALLDRLLSPMPIELRAIFVLYELEGMTMAEIAGALELASRHRGIAPAPRARVFQCALRKSEGCGKMRSEMCR